MSDRRFDIALSFPGDHRTYVEQVASNLAAVFPKDRILYDEWHQAEFARPDLDVYLPNLYRTQSELIVLFLSPQYEAKRWCRLEWRSIRQLIATTDAHRVMLLRYGFGSDLTELGIFDGDGVIDFKKYPASVIAERIHERFLINRGQPVATAAPASAATATPASSEALSIWRRKLEFYYQEQAKAADPEQKFRLLVLIEDTQAKIREHGGVA